METRKNPRRADGKADPILTLKLPVISVVLIGHELNKKIEDLELTLAGVEQVDKLPRIRERSPEELLARDRAKDVMVSGLYYLKVAKEEVDKLIDGLSPDDL